MRPDTNVWMHRHGLSATFTKGTISLKTFCLLPLRIKSSQTLVYSREKNLLLKEPRKEFAPEGANCFL